MFSVREFLDAMNPTQKHCQKLTGKILFFSSILKECEHRRSMDKRVIMQGCYKQLTIGGTERLKSFLQDAVRLLPTEIPIGIRKPLQNIITIPSDASHKKHLGCGFIGGISKNFVLS